MSNQAKGVAPGFLLLPAREYSWELVRRIKIEMPNEGSLTKLLNLAQNAEGLKFAGEDEFLLFADNTLLLWQVVQVLFAAKLYPDLQDTECLNVVALEVENGKVVLHGEVIRSL